MSFIFVTLKIFCCTQINTRKKSLHKLLIITYMFFSFSIFVIFENKLITVECRLMYEIQHQLINKAVVDDE
jgi:hypothetical protein